jgi:hypothetical protein
MMSMDDYVVWRFDEVPHCLVLDKLKGVNRHFELKLGIPRRESFSPDAAFTADPDFPNDISLADAFNNTYRLVVVSQKLKEFIESFNPKEVEFLPVVILDHKSRRAGKYFIVHPINLVDALKPAESGSIWSDLADEWIESVERLVLDMDKLDRSRLLFKLKYFYGCVLIRRDLAEAISKQGFTGCRWVECDQYKSL